MSHDHDHSHVHYSSIKALSISVIIIGSFAIIEAIAGWIANSLVLLGDAGHMAADTLILLIAALAAWLSKRKPSHKSTYGFGRIEVITAFISSILLIAIVIAIATEAMEHLRSPEHVASKIVISIALIGFIINISVASILHHGHQNLNVKAALLHVLSDLFGSMAALIAGIFIFFTEWYPIDPLLSLVICILILIASIRLLRQTFLVLMESAPSSLNITEIANTIKSIENITSVHDLHLWTLTSEQTILSVHIVINNLQNWICTLEHIQQKLKDTYHINHITIQPELNSSQFECENQKICKDSFS